MLQSSSPEKKLVKSLKNFLGPKLHKKGLYRPLSKWKTIFLSETIKADHQLSETICFIKIRLVLTELWILFHLEWCFFVKKVLFPSKTAVNEWLPCREDIKSTKIKDSNFDGEDFVQRGKKKRPVVTSPK